MQRRALLASGGLALLGCTPGSPRVEAAAAHTAWVGQVLERMLSVRKGMTRQALDAVFTTEGGIFTALERTFVSRDCPYFKVSVQFQAVGRPERDAEGRATMVEDARDVIKSITAPFLEFSVAD